MILDVARILRSTFLATVELHRAVGSTSDRAKSCAADPNLKLPLLVLAERQTAGRGRGSHRWWTGQGALACSLLLETPRRLLLQTPGTLLSGPQNFPAAPHAHAGPVAPLVSLAAALAVMETVRPLLGHRMVGIHWPNDLMVDGAKLAGILVETLAGKLVIGIGVNTNNRLSEAPPELHGTAATLFDLTGRPHDHTEILIALLDHLHRLLQQLAQSPERIAALANQACLQHGQTLRVQLGNSVILGRCEGIASDGALVLETSEGLRRLYSGVLIKP